MFLIERARTLIAVFTLFLFSLSAYAGEKLEISLLLGDLDSVTAIDAVRRLKADPALAGVSLHVFPNKDFSRLDVRPLRRSKLVLVNAMGSTLIRAVAPEIGEISKNGGDVFNVGVTWDEKVAAQGFKRDETLAAYMAAGGANNVVAMVRAALQRHAGMTLEVPAPAPMPDYGAYDLSSRKIWDSFESYRKGYSHHRPDRPWIGILFYRSNAVSGQMATVEELTSALEKRGYNVIPFYGFPNEDALRKFAFDKDGKPAIAALGSLGLKIGVKPETIVPILREMNAPAVNLITLNSQTRKQWEESKQGLDIMERGWQVSLAELAGLVAPTVVASKEPFIDPETGLDGIREAPIADRIERAADRLARFVALRETPAKEKRVALLYYNYPPGKENIGASYLNVLPKTLAKMLGRLEREGYDVSGQPKTEEELFTLVRDRGGNINGWNAGTIEERVRKGLADGSVSLLPVKIYREWFDRVVPEKTRAFMLEKWGEPEKSSVMIWRDEKGEAYFVFPTQRFGNIWLAPQPTRGWEQEPEKLYHDTALPPHHQYLAFYLWLQKTVDVHAMIHVGTHATHEWHNGKEVGFTAGDPGELFMGAVPQLYPYIVDNIGEALQAKRRGMAAMISHLTPPLDKASLHPQLRELKELISNLRLATEKSPQLSMAIHTELQKKVKAQGIDKDVGLDSFEDAKSLEQLDDYLQEVQEKATPFGMHTFGVAPEQRLKEATADAILALDTKLTPADHKRRAAEIVAAIDQSATDELDALANGLAGGYVAAGPGNDPVRNPSALPTGRNLYGFDPARLPSPATWAMGKKMAEDFVADFKKRKNEWPTKLVFNLWGVETNRHEGVMEAQIMALMGVKPIWDARGRVTGVEAISRAELGHPRVDVTIIPSGLYRDLFSQVMKRLDEAVTLAQQQGEDDNTMRRNVFAARDELVQKGVSPERAAQLAGVRMFTVPSGAYGTNLDKATPLSNTYGNGKEADDKLSGVYFMRMHHAYGQGLWGDDVQDKPGLGVDLLKQGLKGAQAVLHSRSSNVYAALDGDDFYQYLGGTAMAARVVNGATPEVFVADMSNPSKPAQVTLERYIGKEMRTRYLNPKWIEAMMKEGYAGARFVNYVVENLWGWQVLTPEAIGDAKWQEMYETWVKDRNHLDIKQKFRGAGNLLAYQALVDRMLVAVNKGYWKADAETIAELEKTNMEVIAEAGVACDKYTCSSPKVVALAEAQDKRAMESAKLQPAPAPQTIAANVQASQAPTKSNGEPLPAPAESPQQQQAQSKPTPQSKVEGYEIEEKTRGKTDGPAESEPLIISAILLLAAGLGFASRLIPRRDCT
jgi:cobaltochelatase CobN